MVVLTRAILCLGKQVSRPSVTCSYCQHHHHERQQSSYSGAICPKPMAQLVTSTVYLTVLRYFVLCWGLMPLIHVRFQQCSLLTKLSPALWWLSHCFMKVVHILRSFLNSTGASHMAGSQHSHSLSQGAQGRAPKESPFPVNTSSAASRSGSLVRTCPCSNTFNGSL